MDHFVCGVCRGRHAVVCNNAVAYTSCRDLDLFVLDAKMPCQYAEFGCKSIVAYYRAEDHHITCPSAPCFCPAPDCKFVSSPAKLVQHFHGTHQWPVTGVSYGRPRKLAMPPPEGWHVLVGDGNRAVFLVSASALGAATVLSLVRLAANGGAAVEAGSFWCKVWAELPTNKSNMVMITSSVGTSDLACGLPELDGDMFLVVPPALLHDASGEAPELMVLIDKPKAAAGAASTPKSSTPPSRSSTPPSSSSTPPSRSSSRMLQ